MANPTRVRPDRGDMKSENTAERLAVKRWRYFARRQAVFAATASTTTEAR